MAAYTHRSNKELPQLCVTGIVNITLVTLVYLYLAVLDSQQPNVPEIFLTDFKMNSLNSEAVCAITADIQVRNLNFGTFYALDYMYFYVVKGGQVISKVEVWPLSQVREEIVSHDGWFPVLKSNIGGYKKGDVLDFEVRGWADFDDMGRRKEMQFACRGVGVAVIMKEGVDGTMMGGVKNCLVGDDLLDETGWETPH